MNSDSELLFKAAQHLDEDALNAIFDKFAPALYRYSLRLCHDPTVAENIVGDVFAQLIEQFATDTGPTKNLRNYLYKITYQLLLDHSRANPQNALVELTLLPNENEQYLPKPSQADERVDMQALISAFNTELTYQQRHVIALRFLEDFSIKETAEIIDEKIANTKVIQNRGIAKLRNVMRLDDGSGFSPIKPNNTNQNLPSKSIIDILSSALFGTMTNVASLLLSRKTENIEEYRPKETRLYVGNLPYSIGDANLRNIFSKAGIVKSVQIFKNSESSDSTSFAYLVMSTQEEAIRAMYLFHRKKFDGQTLAVKIGEKEEEDSVDEDFSVDSMDSNKRRLRVFLCHAHKDALTVHAAYERLTNSNIDAWLDKEKLLPGSDWEHEIRRAVRESDIVIVCFSKGFDQRGFRQKEVRIALEESTLQPDGEIFIIPAHLEECEVLPSLRHLHWVNLFEPDGYEKLLRTLKVRAQKIGVVL
jgi:RNA polymerase sigma factor (sigma-70 family)